MAAQEKVVHLPREVDICMREQLRAMLSLEDCSTLVIDLRGTRYIDGASIGEIVRARNLAAAAGKHVIVLVNKSSLIVRIFCAVQLFQTLDIRLCEHSQDICA